MKTKTYYAVFSYTDSGKDYLVKGNFGTNHEKASEWAKEHLSEYPNGLRVSPVNF